MPVARLSRLATLVLRCALLLAAALPLPPAAAQGSPPPGLDSSACAVLWQVTAAPGGCLVRFEVPWWATAYLPVCSAALGRIDTLLR